MLEILYYIIIYPIQLVIEILFNTVYYWHIGIGLTIFVVSLFVNVGSFPMFLSAYRFQKQEKDIQEKMAPRIKSIKANFKGAEMFMILSTYYKQNNYHPIMSLRTSLSLFLEIPFFTAAYLFFTHLNLLTGMNCWFINDLSLPDGLLKIKGLSINVLPILMTVFNIVSGEIYMKNCDFKEKIQMYVLAFVFLVILYDSPSGLVLYWTFNNLISLIRNLIMKIKQFKFFFFYNKVINVNKTTSQKYTSINFIAFFLFVLNTFVVVSFLMPTNIIVSAPTIFYDKSYSYLILLFYISLRFFGIFVFWPIILYFFSSKKLKIFLMYLILNISFIFLLSMFNLFNETFYNVFCYVFVLSLVSFFLYKKKFSIIIKMMIFIILTVFVLSVLNIHKINEYYNHRATFVQSDNIKKIHLSKNNKNIIVFMLDSAIGSYLPYIFSKNKQLNDIYTGFVYYRNTLSYFSSTILALPSVLGGYEYIPKNINKLKNKDILNKIEEGNFVLPKILKDRNWNVTLFDYQYNNNEFHNDYLIGEYSQLYRQEYINSKVNISIKNDISQIDQFVKYSLIYCMPKFLKHLFTNRTNKEYSYLFYTNHFIDNFSALFYLPYITDFKSDNNNFYFIYNLLTHENVDVSQLQSDQYDLFFKNNKLNLYYENYVAYSLIGKFLLYLKENNVYDNTRVVIVADHGESYHYHTPSKSFYNPILFVKDFNANGEYKTDNTFMTNADMPLIVLKDVVDNPINPFTNNKLTNEEKKEGVLLLNALDRYAPKHFKNKVFEKDSKFIYVKDYIFDKKNWIFNYKYQEKNY